MADQQPGPAADVETHSDDEQQTYKVPTKVNAKEMLDKDQDDEALKRYKEELLGKDTAHITGEPVKVNLKKMTLVATEDGHRVEVDLTKIATEKLPTIKVKEGVNYYIEFMFTVENDIVTGLKYSHVVKRKGVKVDKESQMLGSYRPDPATTLTVKVAENDMPSGMMMRGHYNVTSSFLDDDKNKYLEWEWQFDLAKEW